MEQTEMILGLDISTAIIGFTILSRDGNYQTASFIDLSKEKNTYKKLDIVEKRFKFIKELYNISKIFIEDYLQKFSSGFSSAWTINYLTSFNGSVSLLVYQIFKLEPEHINPNTARKLVLGKAREKGKDTKELVLEWAKETYKSYPWEYARTGNNKKQNYDVADSMVIAKAGYNLLSKSENSIV